MSFALFLILFLIKKAFLRQAQDKLSSAWQYVNKSVSIRIVILSLSKDL